MVGSRRENAKVLAKSLLLRGDIEITRGAHLRSLVRLSQELRLDTLIDVGANEGQYARLVRNAGFEGEIYSFEPMKREGKILERRASRDSRWHIVNSALGSAPGTAQINVSSNSYSSSLLDISRRHVDAAPRSAVEHVDSVEVRTLMDELDRLRIAPSRSILKVDTQGYEQEVLLGAGDRLAEFPVLQLELSMVSLYEGGPTFDLFYPWIRGQGFRLWSIEPGFRSANGEMLQCDGVFIRGTDWPPTAVTWPVHGESDE